MPKHRTAEANRKLIRDYTEQVVNEHHAFLSMSAICSADNVAFSAARP
jgi:hypothetical protein